MKHFARRAALVCVLVVGLTQAGDSAAPDKELARVKGVVGYAATIDAPLHRVFGRDLLADDAFAITRANSAAEVVLPDSSIVALGENTRVQVGAFIATAPPGSTIGIKNGSLRFDIRRPQGGTANYQFSTATSQIAVRGTVGLISFLNDTTTVVCLACLPDSVAITVKQRVYNLLTGQYIGIDADGVVVTGPVSAAQIETFARAQVGTTPESGQVGATLGIRANQPPPAAILGAGLGVVGAAALIDTSAHGNGVTSLPASMPSAIATLRPMSSPSPVPTMSAVPTMSPSPSPTPVSTASPTPAPTPTPTSSPSPKPTASPTSSPVPTPTPTVSANIGILNHRIVLTAAPFPTTHPMPGSRHT